MKNDQDFTNDIHNIDEIDGFDIKIKPDYYLHKALEKAQLCLIKDDLKTGLVQFRLLIEHMEVIAKASNMIDEDFDKEILEFKDTKEFKDLEDTTIINTKIAHKKMELIFKAVMKSTVYNGALSLYDPLNK